MFLTRYLLLLLLAFPVNAHEFWIEPERFQVETGQPLKATFRNGQNFKGGALSFFDRNSTRFEMSAEGETRVLTPRAGDNPALDVEAPVGDGLVVVVHETAPSLLTYREWDKFLKFAEHKDFPQAEADHLAAGWPQRDFRESYTRHAKALIAVGSGQGSDKAIGLQTEFVALTNPYDADFSNVMEVLVNFDSTPRPDAQVEVFDRGSDGAVSVTLHRTNANGVASVPVTPGHEYLFDAVTLRPAEDPGSNAKQPILWQTYWAALTFAVPQ